MSKFADSFYNSIQWQRCRSAYKASVGGLCEDCLARGVYTPAEIIHHITPITPTTLNDPEITLNFDNLRALCRECHAKAHGARSKRYTIDELGRVTAKP